MALFTKHLIMTSAIIPQPSLPKYVLGTVDMDFLFLIAITLQISVTIQKKYHSASDESIENILYYKDCNKPTERSAPLEETFRLEEPPPPKQPECMPKMCCSMTCADSCGQDQNQMSRGMSSPMGQTMNQQMGLQGPQMMQPIQSPPRQSMPSFNQRAKKKKKPIQLPAPKPVGTRRDLGFTREHIKALISQDEDIKKILKDLVRVTMKKVDLIDMINARRNSNNMAQQDPNSNDRFSDEDNR